MTVRLGIDLEPLAQLARLWKDMPLDILDFAYAAGTTGAQMLLAPEETLESERGDYRAQALEEGKPEKIIDRIVEGKLEKFYRDTCLMEQSFVKDEDKTIESLINDAIAKLGENIILRRFVRYEVGKDL